MNSQTDTIEFELDGDTVDDDRGFWLGAVEAQIDVTWHLEPIIDADTPLGPKHGNEIIIDDIEGTVYACDQDGGDHETSCDVMDFVTEDMIKDKLIKLI